MVKPERKPRPYELEKVQSTVGKISFTEAPNSSQYVEAKSKTGAIQANIPVCIAVKCTYGEPCALIAQARFWEGPGPTDVQLIVLLEKPVYLTIKAQGDG
jgi:hypothetical protein